MLGRDAGIRADVDAGDPRVLQDVRDEHARVRVGLEDAAEDGPARARGEVPDRRGVRRGCLLRGRVRGRRRALGARAFGEICRVEAVRGLGDAPGELLEVQAVEDDAARPDVDQAGVVGGCGVRTSTSIPGLRQSEEDWVRVRTRVGELLGGDVRFAATEAGRPVNRRLPRQSIDRRGTEIGDLK